MLSVRDHMALLLAGADYANEGRRVSRMYSELGYSETRFWQVVDALIDTPEAEREYPRIVRRLQLRRDLRRAARSA
jgi:hypothetical protein